MRYYVISVQHNWEANAENRSVPKAYDSKNEALKEFHRQLAADMGNDTLDWSICVIINSENFVIMQEKYIRDIPPMVEEAPEEEVTE